MARVDVGERIDVGLSRFQWRVIILCGVSLVVDGFDVQAMGYVAPAVIEAWQIPSSVLGPVFSAALVGVLIGSLGFSVLADRIGRRPVLIGATIYYSLLTFLTARATSLEQLVVIRFLAGIGLGGIMPQAVALAGEYSPARLRPAVMTMVTGAFTAGAAIGGFVAAWLIPTFGWRSVFDFGAIIALLLAALMIVALPESLQFLVLKGKNLHKVRQWLSCISPMAPDEADATFVVAEKARRGLSVFDLFRDGRSAGTLMLWVIMFMNLLDLYFLSSWLPTVVRSAGYPTSIAVLVGTSVQVGGVLGTIALSWWISRVGYIKALSISLALGSVAVALIGQPGLALWGLFTVVFVSGWCVIGGQAAVTSLAGAYYPTELRTTGIGWGLGIGRIGAIVGPLVGGQLLALQWTTRDLFLAAAAPALISAFVLFSLRWVMKPSSAHVTSPGQHTGEIAAAK